MKTAEIAEHLARAAARFPFLGLHDPEQLLAVVRGELGHAEALDDFVPSGTDYVKAIPPRAILHVISGNTPHAGLQSVIRGLLLGAHNLCKMPSAGLPELAAFRDALPAELASKMEVSPELHDAWWERAEAVIVFGSDETVAAMRGRTAAAQTFIAHGHKLSFGVIFDDPAFASTAGAARDASVFDQSGCLSPHCIYVTDRPGEYAAKLATEMAAFQAHTPRRLLAPEESASIAAVRDEFEFRAAADPRIAVFSSPGSTDWTVIFDPDPQFRASCLNRVVFVKPIPSDWPGALRKHRRHLSAAGIFPATLENARRVADLGATRICAIGAMQCPPWTWHQDGGQNFAPLVRWIDAEVSQP